MRSKIVFFFLDKLVFLHNIGLKVKHKCIMAETSETLSQILNESQEMEDENMFGSAGDSQWRTVSYANRKREGSNVEFETYHAMGTDDNLNVLFEKLESVGKIQIDTNWGEKCE